MKLNVEVDITKEHVAGMVAQMIMNDEIIDKNNIMKRIKHTIKKNGTMGLVITSSIDNGETMANALKKVQKLFPLLT